VENRRRVIAMSSESPLKPGKFQSLGEYRKLINWLEGNADWEEIPVEKPHSNVGLFERWFKSNRSGEVWRLVEPDPPYQGLCEEVS
jgi:hypothetical protein